jgi:heterodisulfide reductase subunit A
LTIRIGVCLCECGPHIKEALDLPELVRFAECLPGVVWAATANLLCSEAGKAELADSIALHRLNRLVIAACSPKEHEHTFRGVLRHAGLNPFLLQVANIREQCAWVTEDKTAAMSKAKALIGAAVRRVGHHEELEQTEIPAVPDVLVVGAGVAGISAATALARKGRHVYVVEKDPCIGGKVARYGDLFPHMQCSSCAWEESFDALLSSEAIEVMTSSEVVEATGYRGNFAVEVRRNATFVDPSVCVGCASCVTVCPVIASNEFNEGLDTRKAVYLPYPGSLPHVAVIDKDRCSRIGMKEDCDACMRACPFGAINFEDRDRMAHIKVGAVVLATGFDLFDLGSAPGYGIGEIENVYTSLEMERLLSASGPTEGRLLLRDGRQPGSLAIVHCAGSRTGGSKDYCSEVCCNYLLKFAQQARQQIPDIDIVELFSDLCLPGRHGWELFNRLKDDPGIAFVRTRGPDAVRITASGDEISVSYMDSSGEFQSRSVEMVVLAPPMTGTAASADLARIFDLTADDGGFLLLGRPATDPVSSSREGIFVVGCAQRPMDIASAVARGQAAAGVILAGLLPGDRLDLDPTAASIDEALCSACGACVEVCGYKAVQVDEITNGVRIVSALCRGCGLCVAVCPAGAIKAPHFTYTILAAEIGGLLDCEANG